MGNELCSTSKDPIPVETILKNTLEGVLRWKGFPARVLRARSRLLYPCHTVLTPCTTRSLDLEELS